MGGRLTITLNPPNGGSGEIRSDPATIWTSRFYQARQDLLVLTEIQMA